MLSNGNTYLLFNSLPLSHTGVWDAEGTERGAYLGKVSSMCSNLVGNDSSLYVIPVGQAQMLLRCHIAQQSRPFAREIALISICFPVSHRQSHAATSDAYNYHGKNHMEN